MDPTFIVVSVTPGFFAMAVPKPKSTISPKIPIKSLLKIGLTAVITFAAGCTTVKEAQERLNSLSYYVEYLVRGDTETAGKILKKEGGSRYADLYKLFLPKLRYMEDKQPYFPVFIENRRKRFPQLREYKRAGLIGESSVGYVKIIISNPVTL